MSKKYITFLLFAILINPLCFALSNGDIFHELDLGDTNDIEFEQSDFITGNKLAVSIKREIAKVSNDQPNVATERVTFALKKALIKNGKSLNSIYCQWDRQINVLSIAAINHDFDVVMVLLNYPDETIVEQLLLSADSSGITPLQFAAANGQISIARLMLMKSKNPYKLLNAQDEAGFTAQNKAEIWLNCLTAKFLGDAKNAHRENGLTGLNNFLQNYRVDQKVTCCILL